jgi:CheY-like chemotaxis protein
MLVDDNMIDRLVHRRLLEIHKIGKHISEYDSGETALNFLKENRNDKKEIPDLILLDIMMPGMGGFDFMIHLANLLDQFPKKPLIYMLSSTNDENDIRRVRNNPHVVKMLSKPFSPEALKISLTELEL